jgi:hypothetical protein
VNKGITVRELIAKLEKLVNENPEVADMETLAEGCDCFGECLDAYVTKCGWTHTVVLLSRTKEQK